MRGFESEGMSVCFVAARFGFREREKERKREEECEKGLMDLI